MSASAVRAGQAFVEITANDTQFQRTLKKTQHSIVRLSSTLQRTGTGMAIGGAAMGFPMLLAARSAATFQDSLLELKGATTDLSDGGLAQVRAETLRLSRTMGISATKIAQAFTLLIKAGMPAEKVLAGAGRAAVEFAQVGGVEAAQAAEFMSDSMNVFGVSAETAANTLSAAADSSSTSIAQLVESFSAVASVAAPTGQTIFGVSQALAVLAGQGMKGAEAGTGLKTVLMKLLAPTKEAKDALAVLGLQQEQFVDGAGKMLPIAQIAGIISDSMSDMSDEGRKAMMSNEALIKVFDTFGIRAIFAFASAGKEGFSEIATAMEESRTVSDKFAFAMSGLTGVGNSLMAVVERLAIAFADGGFTKAVRMAADATIWIIDKFAWMLSSVPGLAPILAGLAGGLFAVGIAAVGAGGALQAINFALVGYITAGATATTMTRSFTVAIGGLSTALGTLRAAMFAVPGLGWIAAAAAAVGGVAWWMMSASESAANAAEMANRSGIKRDENRQPMGGVGAPPGGRPAQAGGEAVGTFFGGVASRLAIGPALSVAEETANNTARTADGVEALLEAGRVVPNAGALRAGVVAGGPVQAGGVAATSDRDLISAAERTAMSSERMLEELRRMGAQPGISFL
jgi:hypothetical protein